MLLILPFLLILGKKECYTNSNIQYYPMIVDLQHSKLIGDFERT